MNSKIFRISGLLMISLLLISLLGGVTLSKEYSSTGVNLTISGDEQVFVNQTSEYEVEITGDFGDNAVNWSLKSDVSGPASVSPRVKDSNSSNVFTVELIARNSGDITLKLTAYCSDGEEIRKKKESLEIEAVKPAQITVVVKNPSDINLADVYVGIFVDGELRRTTRIRNLPANSNKNLVINWSKEGLDPGSHDLEVWVDYGYDNSDDFSKGEMILQKTIYIEDEGLSTIYAAIVILIVVAVIAGFLYYQQRRRKRRRPW